MEGVDPLTHGASARHSIRLKSRHQVQDHSTSMLNIYRRDLGLGAAVCLCHTMMTRTVKFIKESNPMRLPNSHVFYIISIHEFFLHHRIKIQQPPFFFYLQSSSTFKQSQITDPRITRNNFFLRKDKRTSETGVTNAVDVAPPSAVGLACVWHPQLDQDPGRSGTGWIRRRQVSSAGRLGPNQVTKEREREKKIHVFLC